MRLLISFAALFLSVMLLQLGSSGVGPLDAISGLQLGFSTADVGLLGSAHFFGFFIGCWAAPRMMGTVGHSRSFAAFTAVGTIGILAHMMIVSPLAWTGLRIMSGFCIAGCFTVVESWLQAKVTNETRGRAMGVYRVVDIGGSLAAQLLIGVLTPAAYVSYNLLALLCCAALVPLVLTRAAEPQIPEAPRLRPQIAWRHSPLAVAGVIVAGLTTAAFRMVGPVYGIEVGLSVESIALFLAAFVAGGALAQIPVGWLADKYDRRWVLIWLSGASIAACGLTVLLSTQGASAIMFASAIFGFMTFPIYSVSAALMFLYALGAIASPLGVSWLIEAFGPSAMFIFIALAHGVLIVYGVIRMRARPSGLVRGKYIYVPRTSFLIGRLLGRGKDDK